MKVFLMHRERDFDLQGDLPPNAAALIQDLELNTLLNAMARGDEFLHHVAKKAVLSSLTAEDAIAYRQQVLCDCLDHPAIIKEMYEIAIEAIEGEKKEYFGVFFRTSPDAILHRSIRVMALFLDRLKRLRQLADAYGGQFRSEGFVRFFRMIAEELDDAFFRCAHDHLNRMAFRNGVLISARLGKGLKGTEYVLRLPLRDSRSWIKRIFGKFERTNSFEIADRDQGGMEALSELRGRGTNLVANALAQSVDHILGFFRTLRAELGFYVSCLNLHEELRRKGEPVCMPVPLAADRPALSARGLYDVCLALRVEERVVGNDVSADGKRLVIITGANQGGKSTFLRSVGLAQLMMQCGMFVAAELFSANVCGGVFTHFKREEDATMKSGKLDEELSRMSEVIDHIGRTCILLCNESFSSTNEREGSEIARQIIRALLERGIKVLFVTHLFDLAQWFCDRRADAVLFLRAERRGDGRRTFKVVEGEPLPTSFGKDLYEEIFGAAGQTVTALPAGARS